MLIILLKKLNINLIARHSICVLKIRIKEKEKLKI